MKFLTVPLLKHLASKEVLSGDIAQITDVILKKNNLVLYAVLHRSVLNHHITQNQCLLPCCFKGNNQ